MARRWLLTVLAGTALSVGLAGSASAQELGDPTVVDLEVVTATVTADTAGATLEVELATDVEAEEAGTDADPTVTAAVSPDGPHLDTDGDVEVVGNDVPLDESTAPLDDAADEPAPAPDQQAAGGDITPARVPVAGPAPVASDDRRSVAHSDTITADRAARSGLRAGMATFASDEVVALSPLVAPAKAEAPTAAADAPKATTVLALPVIDTTPTVPGVLRLLAGLMVLGAAATWRTVRNEFA